jgi:hypothetical protein
LQALSPRIFQTTLPVRWLDLPTIEGMSVEKSETIRPTARSIESRALLSAERQDRMPHARMPVRFSSRRDGVNTAKEG